MQHWLHGSFCFLCSKTLYLYSCSSNSDHRSVDSAWKQPPSPAVKGICANFPSCGFYKQLTKWLSKIPPSPPHLKFHMRDWPAPKGDLKIRYGKGRQGDVLIFAFMASPQAFDCSVKSAWRTWDSDQEVEEAAPLPSTLIKQSWSRRSCALHTEWDWKDEVRSAWSSLERGRMGFALFSSAAFWCRG